MKENPNTVGTTAINNAITINLEDNTLDIKSEEYIQLENELNVKKDEILSIREENEARKNEILKKLELLI